ncbi:NfeD family protein [Leptolyngbya sp. Heron Island J]|uniref:NfeD family protein n=1 Tax=Leptolyngbya sp. Heron Island J TaxID=1385935 RepID=UPI001376AA0C|nr:NfeD family protein [Leptolyngbya sp. Heron Island J]
MSKQSTVKVSNRRTHLTVQEFEQVAEVVEAISPHQRGRVRYRGIYWYAASQQGLCILPKTRVLVLGREANTLLVKPLPVLEKSSAQEITGGQIRHLQTVG